MKNLLLCLMLGVGLSTHAYAWYQPTKSRIHFAEGQGTINRSVHFPRDNPYSQQSPFIAGKEEFTFERALTDSFIQTQVYLKNIDPTKIHQLPNGEFALYPNDGSQQIALVVKFHITAIYQNSDRTTETKTSIADLNPNNAQILATYTAPQASFYSTPRKIQITMEYRGYLSGDISADRPNPPEESFTIPDIQFDIAADGWRNSSSIVNGFPTTVTLRGTSSFTVSRTVSYCTSLNAKTSTISLKDARISQFPLVGSEVNAGDFTLAVGDCRSVNSPYIQNDINNVYVTFSDGLEQSNTGDILSTKNGAGQATGIGLKIYPDGSETPIFFVEQGKRLIGEAQAIQHLSNNQAIRMDYSGSATSVGSASKRFNVKYVRTGNMTVGDINAITTFTFSYQ